MKQVRLNINKSYNLIKNSPLVAWNLIDHIIWVGVKRNNTFTLMHDAYTEDFFAMLKLSGAAQQVSEDVWRIPKDSFIEQPYPEKDLAWPWEDDEFKNVWQDWIDERKEKGIKKYTLKGEQAQLYRLHTESQGNMEVAIATIKECLAHGYQGIYGFEKHLNNNGRKQISQIKSGLDEIDKRFE